MSVFTTSARVLAAALVVPAAVLAGTSQAQAADLNVVCVGAPVGVTCDSTAATINAATSGLQLNGVDDLIAVGPGTYDAAPITINGGANELTLQGSGDATVITLASNASQQTYVFATNAEVRDLKVVMAGGAESSSDWGINTIGGAVQDVTVTGENVVSVTGIIATDSTIDDSTVTLTGSGRAMILIGDGQVSDSSLTGNTAVIAGQASGVQRITRSRITGVSAGVEVSEGEVTVDNSVIALAGTSGGSALRAGNTNPGSANAFITADHVTIVGGGNNSKGAHALADVPEGRHSATILLSNAVINGPQSPIVAYAGNDGNQGGASEAFVQVDYSDVDAEAIDASIGPNGTGGISFGTGNIDAAPLFVDAPSGNYLPGTGSPLIDSGNPAAGTSTLDVLGNPRVADGDNNITAVRDMGAYEVRDTFGAQTSALGGPASPTRDRTPTFTFSSEPGATFSCRIDAKPATACASPYTTPSLADGSHKLTVTARDALGNADLAPSTRTFTVDTVAPNTRFVSTPGTTIRKATARFTFRAPGAVRFQCKIDTKAWRACTSPKTYSVTQGRHVVRVRGIDRAGNVDATPALFRFRRV